MVFSTYWSVQSYKLIYIIVFGTVKNKRKMDQEELKNMTTLGRWT